MSEKDDIPQELRDRVAASDFDNVMKFDCGDDGVLVINKKEVTREDMEADCTIKISRKKFVHGSSVKYAGFIISHQGIKPDPAKTQAIRDFPAPNSVTSLRSFLGLVNQFSPFHPDLAHLTSDLRPLLKKGITFQWLPDHEAAFKKMKEVCPI